ncbi:hypothetical protein PV417_02320 [Streptomyces sp. ME19-03-3]|nr:hypothetical protein [Streptomyces sp. ME19-03-3]
MRLALGFQHRGHTVGGGRPGIGRVGAAVWHSRADGQCCGWCDGGGEQSPGPKGGVRDRGARGGGNARRAHDGGVRAADAAGDLTL